MHALELKVPPVVVVLFIAMLMWLVSWAVPQLGLAFPGRAVVVVALAVAGTITIVLGVASFRLARTTLNPMKPESSTSLVVSGVYKFTRNPMYLGGSFGPGRVGGFLVELACVPSASCFRPLHEPLSNRT